MHILYFLISVVFTVRCGYCANILGVFPMEWGSHYILGSKLMKGLAEAGHDITFISPRKYKNLPKNGSWTDVIVEEYVEEFKAQIENLNFYDDGKRSAQEKMKVYASLLLMMSNRTLRDKHVQKLIHSNLTFDAVIVENVMNDCHHILAYHFKCPLILLSSIGPNLMVNAKVGNPSPVSTVPNFHMTTDESEEMTFIERIKNLYQTVFLHFFQEIYILPYHNRIIHEIFPDAPDISELYYNVSLILLNSHTSLVKAVPVVPNMVEIGGYHIEPPRKLPQDLQEFLDNAKSGAIYFSMGSNIKSKDMSKERKELFLNVFKKLKEKVLWKFEEDLPGKPDNIMISDWMPQQDILAHPNIKLFITHGGLLSTTETIYHGKPVLAIPVFGDQEINACKIVDSGFGLKISYNDANFTEVTLYQLLQELLYNPIYTENAQHRSGLYHDRPITPMQSAVYWVEYVIRHRGAPHLRVAGVGMPWYKYFVVDVLLVLVSSIALALLITKYLFKKLASAFLTRSTKSVKYKTS